MTKVYTSLLHPVTIAGVQEKACYFIWFSVLVTVLAAGQWWMLPVGVCMHLLSMGVSRIDEHFFDVALRSMRYPHCLAC